jgi:predicted membrane-bound mannosyltransferase
VSALLLLFAVFGVALRLRQFLFNRSLWVDEIMLAHNLIHRDIGSLLTEPLTNNQSAAPGFLLAAWSAVTMFGADEYALRLVPLIAGLLVPLLAVVLARHELKSAVAQLAFVALVSFSPVLIFYASEIKQYSSDAFFALAILVSVAYRKSRYGTWLLAGTGLVALTSSLPALFVMAPAALLLLYEAISSSRWRQTVIVGVAWGLAAAIHAAYLLHAGVDRTFMVSWWAKYHGFAGRDPSPAPRQGSSRSGCR